MSKLEELIQKYCPDGVEYLSIGSLITRVRNKGAKNPSVKTVYSVSNTLGLVKAEDFRENVIYSEDTSNYVVVEKGMFAYNPARLNIGSLAWLQTDQPGLVSPMYVVFSINQAKIIPQFLYLHLKSPYVNSKINSLTESGARFRFDFERWGLIDIPVPPIPVQEEIVRVLDTFTELQAELQAELQKRKKQYSEIRESLIGQYSKCDRVFLGDLFPFIRNGFVGTIKPYFTQDTFNGIRYLEGTNIHNGKISDNEVLYVTRDFHNKHIKNELKVGDILMVQSGHIGECAVVGEKYKGANCHALIIMSNGGRCNPQYVVHYFHTYEGFKALAPAITGGTVKHVLAGKMGKISIPLPSLKEQQRIVDILDKFEALTNDLTAGLPAEIEKRRQQYEFYRDKLLTFKRK